MKDRAVGLLFIFFIAFSFRAAAQEEGDGSGKMSRAVNAFAVDLYSQIKGEEANIIFSPYGIFSCLSFAYAGAKSITAEEIARVLRYSGDDLYDNFREFNKAINALSFGRTVAFKIVSSLWADRAFKFYPEYSELVRDDYSNILEKADFKNNFEKERLNINLWMEEKTLGAIKDILPDGSLGAGAQLLLVNGICFRGGWVTAFNAKKTKKRQFWVSEVNVVEVPMMTGQQQCYYRETEKVQVLTMLYYNSNLSLSLILPRQKDGLAELEERLDAEKLESLLKKTGPYTEEVTVYFPKFKIAKALKVSRMLENMGIKEGFNSCGADFTGIADVSRTCDDNLSISGVFHKAYIEVDESGSRRAAYSSQGNMSASIDKMPPVFYADHPFIFVLKDNDTGTILLMGRIANPNEWL